MPVDFKKASQQLAQQRGQQQQSEKPAATFRAGALSVSVWKREHEGKAFYNANAQRAYTEDDGATWEYSGSFGRDDLPVVATLLNRAFEWIIEQ